MNATPCDEHLKKAEEWAAANVSCPGCLTSGKERHTPLCLLFSHITFSRGARGRLVILDPHPAAARLKN